MSNPLKAQAPRNTIQSKDIFEVLRFTFSITFLKAVAFKFAYFIHDHVAPRARMNCKANPRIHPSASLRCGQNIFLGKNSHINQYCCIWASDNSKIILGDNLLMGPGVKIFSSNHGYSDSNLPMNIQAMMERDVVIGSNVWLGSNTIVLSGVSIGNNSIVAAGSVVSKSLPPNTLAAGIPAKFIRNLYAIDPENK